MILLPVAVKKVLTAPIFVNLCKFETEIDTTKKHARKSLEEINQFDLRFFVVSRFVPTLRRFKKIKAVNILTASATCAVRVGLDALCLGIPALSPGLMPFTSLRITQRQIHSC